MTLADQEKARRQVLSIRGQCLTIKNALNVIYVDQQEITFDQWCELSETDQFIINLAISFHNRRIK